MTRNPQNDDGPYPYRLHTNNELEMMLAGEKPFAVFTHANVEGFTKADAMAHQDFAKYVDAGHITEQVWRDKIEQRPAGPLHIDYWFYAMAGEEWRVKAYILLIKLLRRGAWCSQLEWMQGTLLGYTEEQNQYHLSRKYP